MYVGIALAALVLAAYVYSPIIAVARRIAAGLERITEQREAEDRDRKRLLDYATLGQSAHARHEAQLHGLAQAMEWVVQSIARVAPGTERPPRGWGRRATDRPPSSEQEPTHPTGRHRLASLPPAPQGPDDTRG